MKLIAITSPSFIEGEASFIPRLLDWGIDLIHLRKPDATIEACEQLIKNIPPSCYDRIVMHDFFELQAAYGLYGIHLNRRNPSVPDGFSGSLSRSCHSWEEVKGAQEMCDYVFLSPIFDSLSKQGYRSAFSPEELEKAARNGLIHKKIVALGGICAANLPQVRGYGFGGAALLGDLWSRAGAANWEGYVRHLKALAQE
ncbi:thiamine phosphate synthase [Prevotella sp.]|uniref:thiamine phosphate synthase n=1 Tax=Prevotella sp. TaxID=59823 RepID=UPI002F91FAB2